MTPLEYKTFLRESSVELKIPILRCQEALELLVEKASNEQNLYLRTFYTSRAQKLLQSMVVAVPEVETYYRDLGNIFIMALLDEKLEKYETVVSD